jgi:hypothetical protein
MGSLKTTLKKAFVSSPIIWAGRRIEKKRFSKKPVLIVACPRSGTTLLLSILSAVPTIFAIPKQTYAFDKWEKKNNTWVPSRLDKLYREFFKARIPETAHRWLEKTPGHIRSIDKVLEYFHDDVKIIHIIRDGRDVTVSTHPAYTDRRFYWVPADRWATEVNFGLQFKDHPSVYTMRYESLIGDFEGEIRKLLDFLEEPYTERMANWKEHTQIKESIHWGTGVQEVHGKSRGKWRKPEHAERIREFMNTPAAVKLLKDLGYED